MVVNLFMMLLSSFQVRLLVAELMLFSSFEMRREGRFVLVLGTALIGSLPEAATIVCRQSFYSLDCLELFNVNLSFLLVFLASLLMLACCFKVSGYDLLFLGSGAYIIQNLAHDAAGIVETFFPEARSFLGYEYLDLFSTDMEMRFCNAVVVATIVLCYVAIYLTFIRHWTQNYRDDLEKRNKWQLVAFLLTTILLLNIVSSSARNTGALNLYVMVLLFAASLMLLVIQFDIFSLTIVRYERDLEQRALENALEQQKWAEETVNLINIKAHDLKHSLEAIRRGHDEKMVEGELADAQRAIENFDSLAKTGNEALDLILTKKSLYCQQNGISFSFMADGPALAFIDHVDLFVLLGNALDNAIERLLQEDPENRIMSLRVTSRGDNVVLVLENYCSDALEFNNGLPVSTKRDRRFHGFGMRSIERIVEKYHAHLTISLKNSLFTLGIIFPKNQNISL